MGGKLALSGTLTVACIQMPLTLTECFLICKADCHTLPQGLLTEARYEVIRRPVCSDLERPTPKSAPLPPQLPLLLEWAASLGQKSPRSEARSWL